MLKQHLDFLAIGLTALLMLVNLAAPMAASAVIIPGPGGGDGGPQEENGGIELDIRQEASDQELPGSGQSDLDDQASGFSYWFSQFLAITLVIASILVVINLVLGSFKWITSGGDTGKVQEAQQQITHSIIGLIVLAAVLATFVLLSNFLGLEVITVTNSS